MLTRKNEVELKPWQVIKGNKSIPITSIEDMPEGVYGFIYEVTFMDGMKYIGKKNLYTIQTKKALKNGKVRPNAERIYRNSGKGFRIAFDRIKAESNWKTYYGSHEECKNRVPHTRTILHYAFNKLELTYLEAKYLFINEVLENPKYINDNILGSFYRSSLNDSSN